MGATTSTKRKAIMRVKKRATMSAKKRTQLNVEKKTTIRKKMRVIMNVKKRTTLLEKGSNIKCEESSSEREKEQQRM